MVPSTTVMFHFENVHTDRDLRDRWDVVLHTVGDFTISIAGKKIYHEVEFCLVEFAQALAPWLVLSTDQGPDFSYTSVESETEGLVRFTLVAPGAWRVSAAHQEEAVAAPVTTTELRVAVRTYLRNLRQQLSATIDLVDYIADSTVRDVVKHEI